MKKHLMKIIVPMLILIIVTSLGVFSTPVTAQTTTAQEKTMHFMENMLSIDLSKYTVTLQSESIIDEIALGNNRKVTNVIYQLSSEESMLLVNFLVEKDTIWSCGIYTIEGKVIPSTQYLNQLDAVKSFLENYQAYTKIDSSNLIAMLDNVDIAKDSTITTKDAKLSIQNIYISETDQVAFTWTRTVDSVDYTSLELIFDTKCNFISLVDTRVIYTIGDTSINISQEKAIDIALENLQFYSYEMPDGSVVKDFKVSRDAVVATLVTYSGAYELRPYWDIRMFLDEVAPGNVLGITAFIWANTGEIISYSNMATDGIGYPDITAPTDNATVSAPNSNILIIGATAGAIIAILATSILITKKKRA